MARGIAASLVAAGLAAGVTQAAAAAATVKTAPTALATHSGPRGIQAKYAEVENAVTGAAIWGRSQRAEVPMGSITKVMTAYLVIKAGHLGRLITVPKGIIAYDERFGASTAGLQPGQKLTARELLYALLIPSGCDAAYTLAKAYGPGRSKFIAKMNATAAQLGLSRTHFTDFSGLPDPTGYSTYSDAQDLISLGRDAMALPLFASIVKLPEYDLARAPGEHPAFTWYTTNPLIGSYPGAVGIKTGNTQAAGDCLLSEAISDGEAVIGVVLDDPSWTDVTTDSQTLLSYGFSHY